MNVDDGQKTKKNVKGVHTFTEDMANALYDSKTGTIKEILATQEKKEADMERSEASRQNRVYVVLSVLMILFTGVVLGYYIFNKDDGTVSIKPRFTPIIFHNETTLLPVDLLEKKEVFKALWGKVEETEVDSGELDGIYMTEGGSAIGFSRFSEIIKSNLPEYEVGIIKESMLWGAMNTNPVAKEAALIESLKENNKITKTEFVKVGGEEVTLDTSALFKTGTAEFINQEARDNATETVKEFIKDIDLDNSKIKVYGTYSVERPWQDNEKLAEDRMSVGMDILLSALGESEPITEVLADLDIEMDSFGLSIFDVYSAGQIDSMTEEELDKKIDETQGIHYLVEGSTKSEIVAKEVVVEEETGLSKQGVVPSTGKEAFLLLKTRSFEDVFPLVRQWEEKMFLDLYGFFGIEINQDTEYLLTKDFEDGIIKNKNARILYTNEGEIALSYIFVESDKILITNSSDVTEEVVARLLGSQVRK